MATKGDLVEAQRYSRRRLRTAFTSGIPRGVELEPKNHLRSVVGGVAVAVLMVLGSLLFGFLKPGLPNGWDNNKLLIGASSGARYVSIDGTLHPVANLTSAQLLIPAAEYEVMRVDEGKITTAPRGPAVGIVGALEVPAAPEDLLNTGWSACSTDGQVSVSIGSPDVVAEAADNEAAIARVGETYLLLMGGYRYDLPDTEVARNAVLRALSMDTAPIVDVNASWVGLFTPGKPLEEWAIPFIGEPLPTAPNLTIGQVIVFDNKVDTQHYIITKDGELATITPFALQLYARDLAVRPTPVLIPQSDVDFLPLPKAPLVSDDWPTMVPVPVPVTTSLCVEVVTDRAGQAVPMLGTPSASVPADQDEAYPLRPGYTLDMPPTAGALVEVVALEGVSPPDTLYLIDQLGTAYPIPDVTNDTLARLGFTADDIGQVPPGWIEILNPGPALTPEGARAGLGDVEEVADGSGEQDAPTDGEGG